MEPKFPAPNMNPEYRGPQQVPNIESLPLPPSPEMGVERGERGMERRGEMPPAASSVAPALPTPVAIPHIPAPATPGAAAAPTSDSNPSVANDDDLIEKEWVDKAKRIIAETKNDPWRREQEVGKLQVDYLKKRYGKILGASDVSSE